MNKFRRNTRSATFGITLNLPVTAGLGMCSASVSPSPVPCKTRSQTASPATTSPYVGFKSGFPNTPSMSPVPRKTPTFPESPAHFDNDVDTIIDGKLYLGNEQSASDENMLETRGIRHVLNVSHDCDVPIALYTQLGIKYMHVRIKDNSDAPIGDYIDSMLAFISNAIAKNEPILVHCRKGWSRSATVVIAYIIANGRPTKNEPCASYVDALQYVGKRRRSIQPNLGFCMFLNDRSMAVGFGDALF